MKRTQIKAFEINGLFGTDDIVIPFEEGIKILIGENGLGKTQVLNLFYYTLTKNFFRLSEFTFSKLKLTFHDGKSIEIHKSHIEDLIGKIYKHPIVKELVSEIGFAQFEMLRNRYQKEGKNWRKYEDDHIIFNSKVRRNFPLHIMPRVFEELEILENKQTDTLLEKCKQEITAELGKLEIMYFPTYRRVEEDLYNLGYDEDELPLNQENTLIQFGMDDVQDRFNKIENTIDKLLKEGLAQFTKDILNVVIDDAQPSKDILNKINESDIDIILSRVGSLLPDIQKENVKNIVANKQLKNPLSAYLLQKLIDIYEKQKELDKSVKIFRDVCNKYLIDKEVYYDESAIKIYINSKKTDTELSLSKLSSGEKQIISIFSKVYLSAPDKRFMILFDEPELSLSMKWQRQLLPDIINSQKCDFLLAVTHSPFIFENELDQYAVGLNEYVKLPQLVTV